MARFLRTDTNSSGGHSRLRGPEPPIITPAAVFIAQPVQISLAYSKRGKPLSGLGQPKVLLANSSFPQGPMVQYAPSSRGKTKSFLRPPVVVNAVFVASPVEAKLAPSTRLSRGTHLRFPQVVYPAKIYAPIYGLLTPVRDKVPQAHSRLSPPTVVSTGGFVAVPVKVKLAYSVRGKAKSFIRAPVVVSVAEAFYGPQTTLAPQERGTPKPRLFPPAVVASATVFTAAPVEVHVARSFRGTAKPRLLTVPPAFRPIGFTINAHLAYSKRGTPKSRLKPPVVIDLTPQVFFIDRTLVRIKHPPVAHRLFPPTDLNDSQDLGFIAVTLAPQKRGTPKSVLRLPIVIDLRPQTYFLAVTLAASFRGKPKPFLGKPTDLVDRQDLGFVKAHLAYSVRGEPKSRLIPPAVVAPVLAKPIGVHLAPSSHGVPKPRLEPPTVVFPFFARPTDITLVRIRPVPTLHVVRRPVDLVDREDVGFVRVHLAYSVRGKPDSVLRKPVVIDLRPQTYYVTIALAPSRFPKPKSVLRFTKVVDQPQFDSTLLVHLAYPSKGKPKSKLRAPAVVGAGIYFRAVQVELTYSSRRRGKALLRKPTVVAPVLARAVDTTLVRIRPKRTTAIVRKPVVVTAASAAFPIAITLAPSRLPKPKSVLRKPTVVQAFRIPVVQVHLVRIRPVAIHVLLGKPTDLVDQQDVGVVRVHLAPSRFPKPVSRLSPPTVVFPFIARPTDTTFVRIVPPAVHSVLRKPTDLVDDQDLGHVRVTVVRIRPVPVRSLLKPPTVVRRPENIQTATTLVRIRPVAVHSRLSPPAVVGAGIVFRPVLTHLTYSSRGKTMVLLTPMGEGQVCYGTVTGFDFAPSVCGFDEGAVVTGSDFTSHVVTGSDFGATVTGTSAAGGTVTGGDTKREGC